jgi:hypothetical protein
MPSEAMRLPLGFLEVYRRQHMAASSSTGEQCSL